MKRIVSLFVFLVFSYISYAQASGGQIKRNVTRKGIIHKPVVAKNDTKIIYSTPKVVDMGLPSGTLWADRNLGAESPEGYGHFFAWGETKKKNYYSGSNYKYVKWKTNKLTKYCIDPNDGVPDGKTELDLDDDAAYMNLGKNWRTPSDEQFKELVDSRNTKIEWVEYNSVKGMKITSLSNGNYLFFPASGFQSYESPTDENEYGNYWSRDILIDSDSRSAYSFHVSEFDIKHKTVYKNLNFGTRYYGEKIRPVYVP